MPVSMKKIIYSICLFAGWIFFFSSSSFSANLYLSPSSGTLIKNCNNYIDVFMDTADKNILWAAVALSYEPRKIQIQGFYPNETFNLPVKPTNDDNEWIFSTALLSLLLDNKSHRIWFSWTIKYGTIVVRNIENIDTTKLNIQFQFDSAIDWSAIYRFDDGRDILSSVSGAQYTFVNGTCPSAPQDLSQNYLDTQFDFDQNLQHNLALLDRKLHHPLISFIIKYSIYLYSLFVLLLVLLAYYFLRRRYLFISQHNES